MLGEIFFSLQNVKYAAMISLIPIVSPQGNVPGQFFTVGESPEHRACHQGAGACTAVGSGGAGSRYSASKKTTASPATRAMAASSAVRKTSRMAARSRLSRLLGRWPAQTEAARGADCQRDRNQKCQQESKAHNSMIGHRGEALKGHTSTLFNFDGQFSSPSAFCRFSGRFGRWPSAKDLTVFIENLRLVRGLQSLSSHVLWTREV